MQPLLTGLRIIDITTIVLGPFATQILADMGAEVIKVETTAGDMNRAIGPHAGPGLGPMFMNNNRNKRSLAIDLKQAAGKDVLRRLVATGDALVHNMRQDALDRLGFGWAAVHAMNPRLVYCAALGYGSDGPYAGKPAYDDIAQATGGIAGAAWKRDGVPAYNAMVTADKVAALHTVYAVLGALLHRERNGGKGQLVEMPMLEAIAAFVMNENLMAAAVEEKGAVGYHRIMSPSRKPFRTGDGYIALLPYTVAQWTRVLTALGREDVVGEAWFRSDGERSKRSGDLYAILDAVLAGRTSREWLAFFEALDVPCGPVNTLEGLLEDPHLAAVGLFEPGYDTAADPAAANVRRAVRQPVLWRGVERRPDRLAPTVGADTDAILAELGYGDGERRRLADDGVVAHGSGPTRA